MLRKSRPIGRMVLPILITMLTLAPGSWAKPKYKVLYTFKGGRDGHLPIGGVVFDKSGSLYGTTAEGGKGCPPVGCGTVFKLIPQSGGRWTKSILHYFNGSDGASPQVSLVFDKSGSLYGTTKGGGIRGSCAGAGCGVVFKLTPASGGKWKETVLHRFSGGSDGSFSFASVLLDGKGNIYGSTEHGGGSSDDGTVYELSPTAGGDWKEQILHSFNGADGAGPENIIFDKSGNIYSVATYFGEYDSGVAFELSPASGGTWNDTTIYNFQGVPDGALPTSGLTFEGPNLYGTTDVGGTGFGTVFELKPDGNGGWTEGVIYRPSDRKSGGYPGGPLVFDKAGNAYGYGGGDGSCTKRAGACGDLFELMPTSGGSWNLRILHTFTGGKDGAWGGHLIPDDRSNYYGIAAGGGNPSCVGFYGCGVVFEITP
jgi:uncharacterized repeat protein (TIGR03803 family)